MVNMIATSVIVLFVAAVNNCASRHYSPALRIFVPSIGWFIIQLYVARGPFVWYVCSLTMQGFLATLCYLTVGWTSHLVTRSIVFPSLVTALAFGAKGFLPKIGGWTTLAVTLLQLWSLLGGIVILACYPANILQVLEQQAMRDRRFRASARTLLVKKDKSLDTRVIPSLDGKRELHTVVVKQGYETSRWVIYCGGNAEFLENTLGDINVLSDALKAHVILYNPRGIGHSTGHVSQLSDLVEDAAAVARAYMEREKIDEEKLLFFGHSIGGGIVAQVVAECYPRAPFVVDRSFSSMSDAAVAFSYLTPNVTRRVFPMLVGDLQTLAWWGKVKHNNKLVLYSKQDEIINYAVSSIARHPQFQKGGADAERVLELVGTPSSFHNSLLNGFDNFEEVCARMNRLFPK